MTDIELIGILSSAASVGKILSKFFMHPGAITENIEMEYLAEQNQLEYRANFRIPRLGRFSRIPRVQLDCAEGFMSFQVRSEAETESREFTISTIHCSAPPLIGLEEKRPTKERLVFARVQINIDLGHRILEDWSTITPSDTHLKAEVTNTMDIPVRNYQLRTRMPSGRRLKKGIVIQDGSPKQVPLLLRRQVELYCPQGDLEREFPKVDTSNTHCFDASQVEPSFDRSSEIVVPIEHLPENSHLTVNLIFD